MDASVSPIVPAIEEVISLISCNRADGPKTPSCDDSPSIHGLTQAALSVQEDLVICRNDVSAGFPLVAGVVCFPSGWTIAEKIGLPIDAIHSPVPEFQDAMGKSTYALMDRLRIGRLVRRTNWGVRACGQLDQSLKHLSAISTRCNDV